MAKLPVRDIPIGPLPSEIEAVKRLNFFELGLDDYMSVNEYLLSPRSDADLKKHSYAGGGLIKKGIQKLLDSTAFNQSRRKFMKQAGATAAATALPTKTLAALAPKIATEAATRFAPPWIKSMVGVLDQLSGPNAMGRTLSNGTMIRNFGKKGNKQEFEITNSDGYQVPVNMTKEKDGSLHIEFDIRDDFNNNQHIYMDKKTGQVEIVDENYYMTSPEDYAKDDPITWDVTTPSQMDEYAKKMGVMKGDVDDRMKDFASTPEDGDYSDLFESFIDSFSPAGNIFNTKAKARELIKKKIAKQEMMEMDWESQFRGGSLHGFNRGGSTIRPRPKPQQPAMDFDRMLNAMQMVESSNNPKALGPRRQMSPRGGPVGGPRFERAHGLFQILPSTARQPGYGVTPFKNFSNDPYNEAEQRRFAGDYMQAMLNKFDNNYEKAISAYFYGPGNVDKGEYNLPTYYDKVMKHYNKGGMAEKFNINDAVKILKENPQSFVGGGLVKALLAPKVLGKLTDFKPKIAGPDLARVRTDLYTPPEGPYTITNDSGARILDKDFKTLEEAQGALKELATLRTSDASTFKIFGKRPPKTAEGVSEGAPEVNLGMVGKEIPPEQPGAMYWNSREKIIDSPMETMTGQQWLDYLKRPTRNFNPIKDMELNDTSLSTFLSRNAKKPMAKEQLVKDFDNTLAPQLDVTVLGSQSTKDLRSLARKLQKIDLQGYRPGPVKNTLQGLKNNLDSFNTAMEGGKVDEIQGAIKKVDDLVEKNFGLKNVMTEGFPQRFPFELKAPLQSMQQVAGTRAAGFKKYKRNPVHEGTQTLGGGENYREFLFNYKQPAGSPRAIEPEYKYAHDFNLDQSDRMGGFVHMRTSDRTDEFGRRLLHIEEIQSDMHQPINAAARRVKKAQAEGQTNQRAYKDDLKKSKYAPRGDLVKEVDNANEQQMMLIQSKIEDLLAQPQTPQMATRIARLNRERAKVRKIIADKRAKAQEGDHSGVPQGPYAKTEDYNEFVMKYALRAAQEGGYDGISISSSAIKNRSLNPGSRDFGGNIAAYGPMAEGAMKKAAKKSGAKYLKTSIIDDKNRGWEIPMILLKDNPEAAAKIARGLPAYQRGGLAANG